MGKKEGQGDNLGPKKEIKSKVLSKCKRVKQHSFLLRAIHEGQLEI